MEININNLNYTNAKEDSSPHTQVLSVPYSVCIVQYIVYSMQNISCKTWDTLTFFHFQIFLIVAKLFSFCYFHSEHLKCYTLYFWLPFFPSLVFALISTFFWDAFLLIYLLPSFFSSHLTSSISITSLSICSLVISSYLILSYLIFSISTLSSYVNSALQNTESQIVPKETDTQSDTRTNHHADSKSEIQDPAQEKVN